jgi:hypothetical protein
MINVNGQSSIEPYTQVKKMISLKTGTVQTVSLGGLSDEKVVNGKKTSVPVYKKITTKVGKNSTLSNFGIDSFEYLKSFDETPSKDLKICMKDGKKLLANLCDKDDMCMVKSFFKLLRRLK